MSAKKSPKIPVPTDQPKAAAKAATKPGPSQKTSAKARPTKLSALDAAARVLEETKHAMSCPELIEVMAKKGYWTSPGGKTPAATLYSAILRELNAKTKEARFKKSDRGKFARA